MRNRITGHWPISEECDLTASPDQDVWGRYESVVHAKVAQIQVALFQEIRIAEQKAWFTEEQLLAAGTEATRASELAQCGLAQNVHKLRLSARAKITELLGTLPTRNHWKNV